jgi:hypothetical protein
MPLKRISPDAPFRFLDVKIVRSSRDRSQLEWQVFESDGTLLQSSTEPYPDDRAALRAGNAAARAIREAGYAKSLTLF